MAHRVSARRYLSVSLPRLATDRILRLRHGPGWRLAAPPDAPPLVIAGRSDNALRLTAVDEKAAAAGLVRGMGLADARAMMPGIDVEEEAPQADQVLLEAIADWCDRYTPLVALDGNDGMVLDITGCAGLFGGEAALLADLLHKLFHQGFAATAAIAPNPGAAYATARFFPVAASEINSRAGTVPILGNAPEGLVTALSPLPLAALKLDGETLAGLARLGLRRIGDIITRPRAPLARRFGRQLLLHLDRALGHVEEAISPRLPAPVMSVERRLASAITSTDDVERVGDRLAQSLCESLERSGMGARRLQLTLFRVDGAVQRLFVGSSRPQRDPSAIMLLFRERLAALSSDFDPGCGFDLARMSVVASEPLDARDISFLERTTDTAAGLADRLAARLGEDRVLCAVARDTHVPEEAQTLVPAARVLRQKDVSCPVQYEGFIIRPPRLFARPEPVEAMAELPDGPPARFRWRRVLHEVARSEGPERLAGEWWRANAPVRDYYRVEDSRGKRFWLFRQGHYGETAMPRWFMHGLFA